MNQNDKETILKFVLSGTKEDLEEIQLLLNYRKDLLKKNSTGNRKILGFFGG